MIDCMDKRLRDTSKSYLLAYLDPTKTEWLDRHMPSICCWNACVAMCMPSPPCQFKSFIPPSRSGPPLGKLHPLLLSISDELLSKSLLPPDVLFC